MLARERRPGDLQLIAYLVVEAGVAEEELRALLREKLPDHMVPTVFEFLDALPLNPSGKVDRRAFDRRDVPESAAGPTAEFVPPQGELEQLIAESWARALDVDPVIFPKFIRNLIRQGFTLRKRLAVAGSGAVRFRPSPLGRVHQHEGDPAMLRR
ncbi:MAG: hypothetical protein GY856_23320 [bacterium]|nr:hypothetical protein [bacterium]